MSNKVNKNNLDVSRCFIVFMTLCGDVQKTAAALDLDPAVVEKLATDEQWHAKISRVSMLSKSGKPGDYERGVNRALNFAQAHRVRRMLDTILERYEGMDADQILAQITSRTATGASSVSARFFADLVSAMEKTQHLSYLALGDTIGERPDTTTEEGEMNASQMHQAVIQALNNPAMRVPTKKLLNDEQSTHVTQDSKVGDLPPIGDIHPTERKAPGQERSETLEVVAENEQGGQKATV